MSRYIKDGRVAVLYRPSGWYTEHNDEQLVFDPTLVRRVLDQDPTVPEGLAVEWVMPGDRVRPEIYNGQEVVIVLVLGTRPITGLNMPAQQEKWLIA